jgi:hypothetical protein
VYLPLFFFSPREVRPTPFRSPCANGGDPSKEKDEAELMNEIAKCIDSSLERVISYIKSLNLQSHFGHLLGNLSVGVGRLLVGFGDVRNMKYGSTFVCAVFDEYFKLGLMGNFAETLINSWKRRQRMLTSKLIKIKTNLCHAAI